MRRRRLLLVVLALTVGCARSGAAPDAGADAASRLLVGLGVEGGSGPERTVVRAGEPVTLVLFVENHGSAPARVTYPSAQRYDFTISSGGREVWRWSAATGAVFAQAQDEVQVAPGERVVYRETWRGTDNAGQPAPPGPYLARGVVPLTPRPLESPPVTITLAAR